MLARKLRRSLTLPEVLLWQSLRQHRLDGLRFRRQHPVGPFVIDFYCADAKLAVEVEGVVHDGTEQADRDSRRFTWLSTQGIEVLRISAADVLDAGRRLDVEATIAARARALIPPSTAPRAVPLPRFAGEDTRVGGRSSTAAVPVA